MLLWLWLRPAATAPIQPLVEDPIAPSLWQVYPLKKKKCFGASLWCRGLRIQHCHCSSSGSCFGAVLIPGQVTSVCCRLSQKKKKKGIFHLEYTFHSLQGSWHPPHWQIIEAFTKTLQISWHYRYCYHP